MLYGNDNYEVPIGCEHVTIKCGDIIESEAQTVVNTVNCVGVMGTGLALQFKNLYPRMFNEYKMLCDAGQINVGTLYLYRIPNTERIILNFPTKTHYKYGSKIEYIVSGLRKFNDIYKKAGITSAAFPMLGCRNGGLRMIEVFPLMCDFFRDVDIPIEIWFYLDKTPKVESGPLF